jgi:hypothetical protein
MPASPESPCSSAARCASETRAPPAQCDPERDWQPVPHRRRAGLVDLDVALRAARVPGAGRNQIGMQVADGDAGAQPDAPGRRLIASMVAISRLPRSW